MSIAEREPTFIPTEREDVFEATEKGRHRLLGKQATQDFMYLPEVDTAHTREREYLQSRVIGQDAAIESIITALDRSAARAHVDNRPIATFAFLGSTGLGKTETAKALSEVLASEEPNLISIDCAMYSNGHEVSTLTGSPPGYIGREQKPLLNAETVEQDGTVILFDEIEKGARELHNLLLHITDKGELTLNDGSHVSFRNAVIIYTSNLGAREMAREMDGSRAGFGTGSSGLIDKRSVEKVALKGFSDFFTPEFVGRTHPIVFHPLGEEALHQVLDVKLSALNEAYIDNYGAIVNLSPLTREHLVQQALVRKASGVRPLIDALDNDIAATFGRYVDHEQIQEGTEVYVHHRDEADWAPMVHKSDLVFSTIPNMKIKKKVIDVPAPPVPTFTHASPQPVKATDLPEVE